MKAVEEEMEDKMETEEKEKKKEGSILIDLKTQTGDFWIDNGLVILYDMFGEGEHEVSKILSELVSHLIEKTGNVGYYYDLKKQEFIKYDMENWKYPANLFIKATPAPHKIIFEWNNCKKENGSLICDVIEEKTKQNVKIRVPESMREEIEKRYAKKGKLRIFLEIPKRNLSLSWERKKHICSICGAYDIVVKGKQWVYPFLVDPQKFSNFYSMTKGSNYLCPRCALAGLAAYLGWIYAIGKDYMHIFVFHSDLHTLYSLRRGIIKPLALAQNRGRNFPLAFSGKYIHETTMGLILELFKKLKRKEDVDPEIAEFLEEEFIQSKEELRLFAVSGKPGKGFNMTGIIEFSRFNALYKLYNLWLDILSKKYPEEPSVINIISQVFEQFFIIQPNKKVETIWRDKICWMILEFKDPFPYIESYLFEGIGSQKKNVGGLKKGTMVVFEEYAKEVIKMDEKQINIVAAFGHEIGRASAEKDDMGILYSLRNAKNIDDFLKVLNDINFKLGLTVNEEFLKIDGDRIMGQPWIRIKTLLSIYAMNQYLWQKKKEGDKDGE